MAESLMTQDLGRPIRVVFFGGAYLEPTAIDLLTRFDRHPEVELTGGFCHSQGFQLRRRVASVFRRRGLVAPGVLAAVVALALLRFVRRPRYELAVRRRARNVVPRILAVPDIHAPDVLAKVRALNPDLGVVYGAPILKPELFAIPRFGTLGVHHGKLPKYRGVKTGFWAMLNGETTAGVTIQRINSGVDTGDVIAEAELPIVGKRYGRVDSELHELGVDIFMDAVLAVKQGRATAKTVERGPSRMYRQPGVRDILRLWGRQLRLTHRNS
jgi:folate-dependent phosphoribosylglycinamide formyltransferase PurN